MPLPSYLRNKLIRHVVHYHAARLVDEAESIAYEGINFYGIKNYTDEELVQEYAYNNALDQDEDMAAADSLYCQCLAELGIEKMITK